jgi:hypothetical protein
MLYEKLRSGLESNTDLSMEGLIRSLDKNYAELDEQYAGEIMVGLMFAATLAIERSASPWVAKRIVSGMKAEFLHHLQEQGASEVQQEEWEAIITGHFLVYQQCLEGYTGFEPPWKLGRQFYWNIIGREDYLAMSVKIATLFLVSARDVCQDLLNEFGPILAMNKTA